MSASESHRDEIVPKDQVHLTKSSIWAKIPMLAGVVGVAALGGAWALGQQHGPAGFEHGPKQDFFFAYLTALMFFLALGLGGLFFVVVQHAVRAGWSIVCRRMAENMALTLPVLGLLVLPVVFVGTHDLFHWSHLEVVASDPVLTAKQPFLNEGFFHIRALFYIGIWSLLGVGYWRWSTSQDTAADPKPVAHKMRWFAPISIVLFALSMTFGAFDWLMSLDPHWFSTMFGVYYFAGCVVSTHAFLALMFVLLHRTGFMRGVVTPEHFHDLGKMMFAFTVFWGYIGFSQYFLIWYASIPEETEWYAYRGEGEYLALSIVLVFARFVVPFFAIMSRKIKRNPLTLGIAAVWILAAQAIDMFWLVKPVLSHARATAAIEALGPHASPGAIETVKHTFYTVTVGPLDILCFVGIGGIFIAVVTWAMNRHALVPLKDPRLAESVNFENF